MVGQKFKIFNNKPDRGEKKNHNNSRIYLKKKKRLFYFVSYTIISIYTSRKFFPST